MITEAKRDKIRQSAAAILGGLVANPDNSHKSETYLCRVAIDLAFKLEEELENRNV